MNKEEDNKHFHLWKPEDDIFLFIKIREEMHRLNRLNPDLIQINHNTWVHKKDYGRN